jgi:hypothetical protein
MREAMKYVDKIRDRHVRDTEDLAKRRYGWASTHKDRGELLRRVSELEDEVKHLGQIGNVCTYPTLRQVCFGCLCDRKPVQEGGKP